MLHLPTVLPLSSIRALIQDRVLTRVSRASGVNYQTVHRCMHGGGISAQNAEKLSRYLLNQDGQDDQDDQDDQDREGRCAD